MKKLQLVIKILAIGLIVAIAFVGIYVQKQNRMENIVKDYSLGMDLGGARVIELKVSDDTNTITKDKNGKIVKDADKDEEKEKNGEYTTEEKPVNSDESKTLDNYKKSKSIIEKRLDKLGVVNYVTKLDEDNGKIIIEIPENDETDHVVSNISQTGKFEIVDSEDQENVLMNNSDIKNVSALYNTGSTGTVVYLNILFNKDGAEKIKKISNDYATVEKNTEDSTEETKSDEEKTEETKEEQKKISLKIDDSEMISSSFDEPIENGSIQLTMGQASTDKAKISESLKSASTIATVLNNGELPLTYELESNKIIFSDITKDVLVKIVIGAGVILLLGVVFLIVKYKKAGILAGLELIGLVALYSLLVRYTNVLITLEGMSAMAVVIVINYVFVYKVLKALNSVEGEERTKTFTNEYNSFCVKTIPICILSIVFSFVNWEPISSFGMTMFWGLTLTAIYNITVTKKFLK